MFIAGETSGDLLAAELVPHLRRRILEQETSSAEDPQPLHTPLEPLFFGAGGAHMAAAGVDVRVDLTRHAVVGLWEVVKKYREFRGLYYHLLAMAGHELPDAIICIDFSGFNLRFAEALRRDINRRKGSFGNWRPRLIQYVSPQVWASRPGRAQRLGKACDLLLSIFPFEAEWYAQRVPGLSVEFIGHPLVDRYARSAATLAGAASGGGARPFDPNAPAIVLLPGSRVGELRRHVPIMLGALDQLRVAKPRLRACMVFPTKTLEELARQMGLPAHLEVQVGDLAGALSRADLAIASTGTVTLECAYFGVPTVAFYKTSWSTYQIGKRLIQVKYLAMPNLLADEVVFPEFIQEAATSGHLAGAGLELLGDANRRLALRGKLAKVVQSLGAPGASARAALAISRLFGDERNRRPIPSSAGPFR